MEFITQNILFECFILVFSTHFCPIRIDLSGNTVLQQVSDFQKPFKKDHFWHFVRFLRPREFSENSKKISENSENFPWNSQLLVKTIYSGIESQIEWNGHKLGP